MTTGSALLDLALLLAINIALFSFIEWWIHRTFMHRRPLPKSWYERLPYIGGVFENHAQLHHQVYYREYDHEPDPLGRELNIRLTWHETVATNLLLAPLHALWALLNPMGNLAIVLMLIAYTALWSALHAEMHMPTRRWCFRNPAFKFLNRHHYLHHAHPGRNFNVVLPFADFVLGTAAKASLQDTEQMRRLGI